jgi:hypothetical protein
MAGSLGTGFVLSKAAARRRRAGRGRRLAAGWRAFVWLQQALIRCNCAHPCPWTACLQGALLLSKSLLQDITPAPIKRLLPDLPLLQGGSDGGGEAEARLRRRQEQAERGQQEAQVGGVCLPSNTCLPVCWQPPQGDGGASAADHGLRCCALQPPGWAVPPGLPICMIVPMPGRR